MPRDTTRILALCSVAIIWALSGCTSLEPHRTRFAKADVACSADTATQPECRNAIVEHAPDYDLHFVEFDDQGLQYPDDPQPPYAGRSDAVVAAECAAAQERDHCQAWAYQINHVVRELDRAADARPITLMVFIHGWKHDASADDSNVKAFRQLLENMAQIEQNRQRIEHDAGARESQPRKVVGLYVGWRGHSIDVPGLDNVNVLETRKTAAMHVAEGSSRELFARLRAFKCQYNAAPASASEGTRRAVVAAARECTLAPRRDDHVKIILIGHSFGGLILYNSLSGSLIESMTRAFDAHASDDARYWRFADLAVLINPAFEATRYAPLQRIAATSESARYEPPLLVTVTSTTDTATGFWFKAGRFVNTLFERHASDDEKTANRETIGHHAAYLTHRLELTQDVTAECAGWQLGDMKLPADRMAAVLARDLPREYNNSQAFFRRHEARAGDPVFRLAEGPWVRDFCGGTRLTLTGGKPNSPIWNISAIGDPDLLPNHNDINEPRFVAFFRQLYIDTIFLDLMVDSKSIPAIVTP